MKVPGLKTAAAALIMFLLAGSANSQQIRRGRIEGDWPEGEFHMARVVYRTFGGAGSRGFVQPWWAIDYPYAEAHFLPALRRMTNMSVADDSIHLELSDERIFQYPFLFLQQPGQGGWSPNKVEAANLRQHLLRGGFMLVDDLHSEYDWQVFHAGLQRVFPDRPVVDIPETDTIMNIFYDLDQKTQVPGERHLRMYRGGEIFTQMEGPARWRGVYDDDGRLMVAVNFNMDMGDAWEHADDPYYPVPMTALAYKLGINYVLYAMTH
jgi:hypothetical protein